MRRNRRRVLRLSSVVLAGGLAGCNALPDETPSLRDCQLSHEIATDADATAYDPVNVSYADLSERGREVVDRAIEEDGYAVAYDGSNAPEDFDYSDEMTEYRVEYGDETYLLRTYTSEGCTIS